MPFGWIKALQVAYSLYTTGTKVAPLLRRRQQGAGAPHESNSELAELASALQALALETAEHRRMLRVIRAASLTAVGVSVVTLILVITHIAYA